MRNKKKNYKCFEFIFIRYGCFLKACSFCFEKFLLSYSFHLKNKNTTNGCSANWNNNNNINNNNNNNNNNDNNNNNNNNNDNNNNNSSNNNNNNDKNNHNIIQIPFQVDFLRTASTLTAKRLHFKDKKQNLYEQIRD